jgi:NADPH:quinone reductase-like Zn-dependent oxidoreductase
MFALKLTRAAGLRTILAFSSNEKLDQMRDRFADPPILSDNYATNPVWDNEVLKLTNGVGVEIVVENGKLGLWSRALHVLGAVGLSARSGTSLNKTSWT